jgi:chromate transporter
MPDAPVEDNKPAPSRLTGVARVFLKLGFTAFGGPAAHVALMEDEIVHRRGWLDRQHFLDMVSTVNFVPGPNSTELAIHVGLVRAGFKGLIVAGVCFIVPAMLIILPIAAFYVAVRTARRAVEDALDGIKACMVAIVVVAMVRFMKTGVKDRFTGAGRGARIDPRAGLQTFQRPATGADHPRRRRHRGNDLLPRTRPPAGSPRRLVR